jgi:aquaporin Z
MAPSERVDGRGEAAEMDMDLLDPRKLVAELVGTFALIFFGAGSIIMSGGDIVAVALAHGLAIALSVSALMGVSHALFNPALTIGLWATRRLETVTAGGYIIAQLAGAVLAALLLVMLFPEVRRDAVHLGTPLLDPEAIDAAQGVGIEAILTFFLMLAVFGTAVDSRGPRVGGFGIGLVLTMDILAAGPLTGAAMNPARSFGPALVDGSWDDWWVYWVGPVIGAVLAALLYHYVFAEEEGAPMAA